MGRKCVTHGKDEKCRPIQELIQKREIRHKFEDNIKMDVTKFR